ncbi:MAG: RdgB/HAM1 family non-canonical purine NTP pyrophosphatase [Candidatus Lindowbacteria bacterium]|nr:RdgB/HAM1 family non-canonical purine NTP pyrophosphatase [Candidatus Lindowbacteria bacterium]
MKLLIATRNPGKVREITKILEGLPLQILSLKSLEGVKPVPETGHSFAENARIKATAYYRQTGILTLSEDSGLQVDCLEGQPGRLSARFAAEDASDSDNVKKLLRLMRGVKTELRNARFVCAVAIADGRTVWLATGKCEGRIAHRPIGHNGFGYDPVFIPEGHVRTFANLGMPVKNEVSHRAQALKKARRILERLIEKYPRENENIRSRSGTSRPRVS